MARPAVGAYLFSSLSLLSGHSGSSHSPLPINTQGNVSQLSRQDHTCTASWMYLCSRISWRAWWPIGPRVTLKSGTTRDTIISITTVITLGEMDRTELYSYRSC